MQNKFRSLLSLMLKLESAVGALSILFIALFVISDVLSREIFNVGFSWAQKTSVYLMLWAGFLGAAITASKAAHLRPQVGDKVWKNHLVLFIRVQNILQLFFSLLMTYASYQYVNESFEFGDRSVSLDLPLWIIQLVIPYGFLSIGLRSFYFLLYPSDQKLLMDQDGVVS